MTEKNKENKTGMAKAKTADQKKAVRELIDLLSAGQCKGIKGGTVFRLEAFAMDRGFI